MWRTEDGGMNWSAVRGAPGGDDYQKIWVNPSNTNLILAVSDQGGVVVGTRPPASSTDSRHATDAFERRMAVTAVASTSAMARPSGGSDRRQSSIAGCPKVPTTNRRIAVA